MMIFKLNKLFILFIGENCGKNIRMIDLKYFIIIKKGKFGDYRVIIFYQYIVYEMFSYILNLLNVIVKFFYIFNFYFKELYFYIIMNRDMYILTVVS